MRKNDIVTGFIVLVIFALILVFFRKSQVPSITDIEKLQEKESQIEEDFKIEIPEDLEKAVLEDVSGGISGGIATRDFKNGKYIHTALADLPDPEGAMFYEGWLIKGDDFISTGKMRIAKGGYILEFESTTDYSDYDGVVITLEKIFDNNPEKHILEGSF